MGNAVTDANFSVAEAGLDSPGVFNALAYGAKADGVTDNAQAYANLLTAVQANGSGILYFPAGRYYSSIALLLGATGNDIWVQGDGIDSTVFLPSTSNTGGQGDGIRVVNSGTPYNQRVTVMDLTIDCSNTYPGLTNLGSLPAPFSNGITMQGVDDVRIERVKVIKPAGFGVQISSPGGAQAPFVQRPVVRDLYVEGERGGYDSLGGGGIINGRVEGLYVYPATDGTNPYGTATDWTNHRGTSIRGVRATASFVYGISSSTTPAVAVSTIQVANPYAFPVTVTLSGGTYTAVFINNVSSGTGGTYTLPAFGTISITYSIAPTWTWTVPTAPSLAATGVAMTNPFPYPVSVDVTGGTVSAVAINGVTQAGTSGFFLVPATTGTITITYSAAPTVTWATTNSASAINTDFGIVSAFYDDCVINGFKNGFVISQSTTGLQDSKVVVSNCRIFNVAFSGIRTNVATGRGVTFTVIRDNFIDSYGMSSASGAGILVNGSNGFILSGNQFGFYGNSIPAIQLATDGTNQCSNGLVFGNNMVNVPANTITTTGSEVNVVIEKNPGFNPVGLETVSVPSSGSAAAAVSYDRWFYVTAGASTCAIAVVNGAGTGQTVTTIPALAYAPVFVPAGSTLTPTYANAPTWTVQGL